MMVHLNRNAIVSTLLFNKSLLLLGLPCYKFFFIYIYIYIYISLYVKIYIYIYIYTYRHRYLFTLKCHYIYIYIYIYILALTFLRSFSYISAGRKVRRWISFLNKHKLSNTEINPCCIVTIFNL